MHVAIRRERAWCVDLYTEQGVDDFQGFLDSFSYGTRHNQKDKE